MFQFTLCSDDTFSSFWEGRPPRFGSVFMGIFDHSSRSACVRSHTDVGGEGLARIHPKKVLGVRAEVRTLCARPVKFIHTRTLSSPCLYGPCFVHHATAQCTKHRSPGNRQTHTRPSDCQMEKCDSSLQRTCLHRSRVQWRRASHQCPPTLCIALGDVRLGCSGSAMEARSKFSAHRSRANLKAV